MTRDDARTWLASALQQIAPDVALDAIDPDAPFQEEADIDSMDFLNLVVAIHEVSGIEIPERDYGRLATVTSILAYLEERSRSVA